MSKPKIQEARIKFCADSDCGRRLAELQKHYGVDAATIVRMGIKRLYDETFAEQTAALVTQALEKSA